MFPFFCSDLVGKVSIQAVPGPQGRCSFLCSKDMLYTCMDCLE